MGQRVKQRRANVQQHSIENGGVNVLSIQDLDFGASGFRLQASGFNIFLKIASLYQLLADLLHDKSFKGLAQSV